MKDLPIILQSIHREPSMKNHMEDLNEPKDEEMYEHLGNHCVFGNCLLFDDEEKDTLDDDFYDDDLILECSNPPSYIKDGPLYEPFPLEKEGEQSSTLIPPPHPKEVKKSWVEIAEEGSDASIEELIPFDDDPSSSVSKEDKDTSLPNEIMIGEMVLSLKDWYKPL